MRKRELNVDLFRIIATIFVILLHVLRQGGILQNTSPNGAKYCVAWFLEIGAFCAVNCFAIISGYVMCDKKVKSKSIIGLWFQVLFYSVLFTVLFFVFVPETRTIKNMVIAILPIIGKQWWYISSYFALVFAIPFLNEGIKSISQHTYKKILIFILIGICCIDCVIPIDAFTISYGYSAIWLMIGYIFGAYIKKYDLKQKTTALKSLLSFGVLSVLTFASKIAIHFISKKIWGQPRNEDMFVTYISISVFLSSIYLFLFCLNIKISGLGAKLVRFFSPLTLGVYLVHVHPFVFKYVIMGAFVSFADKPLLLMLIYIFAAVFAIFLLCAVIELLRIQLFKLIKIEKFSGMVGEKINSFCLKVSDK